MPWKTVWAFLKNLKKKITIWPNNATPEYFPKEQKAGIQTDTCTPTLTAALFTKGGSNPSAYQQRSGFSPMAHYSASKRKEMLTHATTQMDLKDIMLSDIRQTEKGTYCMTALKWGPQSSQIRRDRKQNCGCQGREDSGSRQCWKSTVSVWGDEEALEMDDNGDSSTTIWIYLKSPNYTFKRFKR